MNTMIVVVMLRLMQTEVEDYPAWFLNPPDDPDIITVAYVGEHFYRDSAVVAMRRHAVMEFEHQKGVRITGGSMFTRTGQGVNLVGSDITERFLDEVTTEVESNFFVSAYQVRGSTVLGCISRGKPRGVARRFITLTKEPKPLWLTQPTIFKGHLSATGVSASAGVLHEGSAWQRAEAAAREQLAHTTLVRVKSMSVGDRSQGFVGVEVHDTDVTLKEWRVRSRWKDSFSGQCYVLMTVPFEARVSP